MKTRGSPTITTGDGDMIELEQMPYQKGGKKVTAYKILIKDAHGQPVRGTPRLEYVPEGCILVLDERAE